MIAICVISTFNPTAYANAPSGIKNNGLGGIYIDINSAPFTTFAGYSYGQYAYTSSGCAWYASARVNQLTGKGSTIRSASNWWNNCESYGFSRGSTPKAGSIICLQGSFEHVAIIEKIEGDTVYISEGGFKSVGSAYGYCRIRKTTIGNIESEYRSWSGLSLIGYVYFGGGETASPLTGAWVNVSSNSIYCEDTLTLSWGAVNATGYWIDIWRDDTSYVSENMGTSTTLTRKFPPGKYVVYITATNSIGRCEGSAQFFSHIGDDFFAYIIHTSSWNHLTYDSNSNVSARALTGSPKQIWHFKRISDNSYKITSAADSKSLNVYNQSNASGANVNVSTYNGNSGQI